jgi:hypothetical protein
MRLPDAGQAQVQAHVPDPKADVKYSATVMSTAPDRGALDDEAQEAVGLPDHRSVLSVERWRRGRGGCSTERVPTITADGGAGEPPPPEILCFGLLQSPLQSRIRGLPLYRNQHYWM